MTINSAQDMFEKSFQTQMEDSAIILQALEGAGHTLEEAIQIATIYGQRAIFLALCKTAANQIPVVEAASTYATILPELHDDLMFLSLTRDLDIKEN